MWPSWRFGDNLPPVWFVLAALIAVFSALLFPLLRRVDALLTLILVTRDRSAEVVACPQQPRTTRAP